MQLTGSGYGRVVAVRCADADVSEIRALLPFWWTDVDARPERTWTVEIRTARDAIGELELWVAEHAVGVVFVHAGAVAIDGRALLLPGRSMSGKTTLVAALLRAGADYLSDEYAVLSPDGLVHPYPRRLRMRTADGWKAVEPSVLGARTCVRPCAVAAVASLVHRSGGEWLVRQVPRTSAAMGLLDNAVAARSASARVLDAVAAAVADAVCQAGERGEAAHAELAVLLPRQG